MPYIQTIGEEYPDASLEDMITLIRITFDELGRLYRDGMMTEEEFLIQTNGFCISSELLNRQGIKLVKQPILSDIPQKMQDAFALLKILQVSEKDVQAGRARPAKQVFQKLRKELNAKK